MRCDYAAMLKNVKDKIAQQAIRALMTEVCIAPKPGLVDRTNNGAHKDMDIFTFIDSASSIFSYFREIVDYSSCYTGDLAELLPKLTPMGIQAERDMFLATGGVNTHKGVIFSLGVLCAAVAVTSKSTELGLAEVCATIAGSRIRGQEATNARNTHGEQVFVQHGLTGILGESGKGFPNVFKVALPVLKRYIEAGNSIEEAGVVALLHLIASVDDTNIITRSDIYTLQKIKSEVKTKISAFTDVRSYIEYAKELDVEFIKQGISPGGSADLLACTLFVYYCGVSS